MLDQPKTVREVTDRIRELFESDPLLSDVWITGEVLESSVTRSGHTFFTLAGDEAQIRCVLFRMNALRQRTLPSPGSACVAHGRVEVYAADGSYQLYVDLVEEAGIGLAALELELLRQQLEAEGLFAETRKRPLPAKPGVIGVITSESGAVWHDIQNVVRRRFPFAQLILSPAAVQGEAAAAGLVGALQTLILDGRAEVILIARGGGSTSDLAAFNDESLLRTAFASPVPIVSAIGHETDWSLLDLVADLRAPTPSAAAELVTPSIESALNALGDALRGHVTRFERDLATRTMDIERLIARFDRIGPSVALPRARARLEAARAELGAIAARQIEQLGAQFQTEATALNATYERGRQRRADRSARAIDLLTALSPTKTMARGYASIEHRDTGQPVRSAGAAAAGDVLRSRFLDGSFESTVSTVTLVTS
jgi:exodeoxyribonuclease VII large subunit